MMATKLRTQEVAALRRALDSERYATKLAQEKNAELQKALEGEQRAMRALRRDMAAQIKSAREEECNKYTAIIEQLKTRMTLGQTEAVEMQKEATARALAGEFQREMHLREEELKKEARKQIALLQEQLKEAVKSQQQELAESEKHALIHSLHAEYQRTLHAKQEDWKRESRMQVENVTDQLREAQRQCQELTAKLATTTNDAEQSHKLRQELQTLRMHNKEMEEKIQVLTEADRRKVEEFRSQYEEFEARTNEMQKAARREAHQLLEEIKSKDRHLAELGRELHLLTTRLNVQRELQTSFRNVSRSRLNSNSSSRMRLDAERPGEPPRLCLRRPKSQVFVSELAKRVRGAEARPKPTDRNFATKDTHTTVQDHEDTIAMEVDPTDKTTESRTTTTSNTNIQNKTYTSEGTTTEDLINNSWTKVVGLDTLYKLLCEEHQELQRTYQAVCAKLRDEERARVKLEEQFRDWKRAESENAINLAMAEQIQALLDRQGELEAEVLELREQNDLLEFRILELDDSICSHSGSIHAKSPPSRSPDTRDVTELDDISDSGVMSLTTSEDISESDFQDYKVELSNREIKSKLTQMCQNVDNINDQICLQQTLALLRHYESRLESLEGTLAAMCQEATMTRSSSILSDTSIPLNSDTSKSPSRIIATVLPFTDPSTNCDKESTEEYPTKKLLKDVDCLQESGIFEGSSELVTQGTQTDWTVDKCSTPPGDLGTEIRKLTQIRERIEEQGGNKKLLKIPGSGDDDINTHARLKDLIFYRERLELLENKLAVYESKGDKQSKLLEARLEREVLLAAQVEYLKNTVKRLQVENRLLEEEKCEYEEAENDTRLRCQKLEVKLSALGEKKSDLQVQLQQNARTMSNLRSTLSEEERKRVESKQRMARLENTVSRLEQQNFELEEREMEIRCRLQVLEITLPALMVWFLWRLLNSVRPYIRTNLVNGNTIVLREIADAPVTGSSDIEIIGTSKRNKLKERLRILEQNLEEEGAKLYESKKAEEELKYRIEELQQTIKLRSQQHIENSAKSGEDPKKAQLELRCKELELKCRDLEKKVGQYEKREETYTSNVQEVDDFWDMDKAKLREIISQLEDKLLEKDKELDRVGSHAKKLSISQEVETQLQEHIQQLQQEMSEINERLLFREKEYKMKEETEKNLWQELSEAVEQLDYFKSTVETALKDEIQELKKKNKELREQLDILSQSEQESRDSQAATIMELKSSLRQKSKDLEENEVNISELKEEVFTLENALIEQKSLTEKERNEKEIYQIEVGVELAAKDDEIRRLSYEMSQGQTASLAESLVGDKDLMLGSPYVTAEDPSDGKAMEFGTEPQVDNDSTMDVTASRSPSTKQHILIDCLRSQILVAEDVSADVPVFVDRLQAALVDSIDCQNCMKNGTIEKLQQLLNVIEETDNETREADCLNSRLEVERFHSTYVPRLTNAFLHSKECQKCIDNSTTRDLNAILSRLRWPGDLLPDLNGTFPNDVLSQDPERTLIASKVDEPAFKIDDVSSDILPASLSAKEIQPSGEILPAQTPDITDLSDDKIYSVPLPGEETQLPSDQISSESTQQIPDPVLDGVSPVSLPGEETQSSSDQISSELTKQISDPVDGVSPISLPIEETQLPSDEFLPAQRPDITDISDDEISSVLLPVEETQLPSDQISSDLTKQIPDPVIDGVSPVSLSVEEKQLPSDEIVSEIKAQIPAPIDEIPVVSVGEIPSELTQQLPNSSVNENVPVSSPTEDTQSPSEVPFVPNAPADEIIPASLSVEETQPLSAGVESELKPILQDSPAGKTPFESSQGAIHLEEAFQPLDEISSDAVALKEPLPKTTQPLSDEIPSIKSEIPIKSKELSSEEQLETIVAKRASFMPDSKSQENVHPGSKPDTQKFSPDNLSSKRPIQPYQDIPSTPTPETFSKHKGLIHPDVPLSTDIISGPPNLPSITQGTDSTQWTVNTLKLKCRVKDHFIKSLADQLKELSSHKAWSSNRLQGIISKDPVKTYDFDRVTLIEYIEGNPPPEMIAALKSEPPYSSKNVLDFKVINKYGADCLLVQWSPAPANNVTGFQIFVNGHLNQRVHSPARNKALLHPVDFNEGQLLIQLFTVENEGHTDEAARILYPQ